MNETYELIHIYVGYSQIKSTAPHPFWVEGKGWVEAGNLLEGDKVKLYSGEVLEIKEIRRERLEEPVKTYNFEVEDWHTYLVSENNVLVHNAGSKKCPLKFSFKSNKSNAGVGNGNLIRTVGENGQTKVYRVIRPDENPLNGLTAKNPQRNMTVEGHITSGSRNKGSQYISTTTDINVAKKWAEKTGNKIVEIDLAKLPDNVNVIDLSTDAGRNAYLKGSTAKGLAKGSSEVLIEGNIPSEAIKSMK